LGQAQSRECRRQSLSYCQDLWIKIFYAASGSALAVATGLDELSVDESGSGTA
jgi:hypothetical protein